MVTQLAAMLEKAPFYSFYSSLRLSFSSWLHKLRGKIVLCTWSIEGIGMERKENNESRRARKTSRRSELIALHQLLFQLCTFEPLHFNRPERRRRRHFHTPLLLDANSLSISSSSTYSGCTASSETQ
jgi:hypothetical protein